MEAREGESSLTPKQDETMGQKQREERSETPALHYLAKHLKLWRRRTVLGRGPHWRERKVHWRAILVSSAQELNPKQQTKSLPPPQQRLKIPMTRP
jgi:hypothetical protein